MLGTTSCGVTRGHINPFNKGDSVMAKKTVKKAAKKAAKKAPAAKKGCKGCKK